MRYIDWLYRLPWHLSRTNEKQIRVFLDENIASLKQGKSLVETVIPVVRSTFAPASYGPMVDLVTEVAASTPPATFCAAIEAIANHNGIATLKQVRVPTRLITGAMDMAGRPEDIEKIRDLIPQARFACVQDAGHYAFAEQHNVFNEHLLDFIESDVNTAA